MGRLHYLENRFDKSHFYLNKAVNINLSDPRPCFYLGLIADQKSDTKEKERYFELARKKGSFLKNQVGFHYYESRPGYFMYPGYLDIIEQDYRNMLELDDNVKTKNEFAFFLAIENRNLEEAFKLINEVLKEDSDIGYLDTKAVILYQQGEYQKAHEIVLQYEKRINKDDLEEDPTYSYYLGKIKWAVGDTVSAKNYFKYTLIQTEPDASGKRDQQELVKFMDEHNL